jgi:hypothetical protein
VIQDDLRQETNQMKYLGLHTSSSILKTVTTSNANTLPANLAAVKLSVQANQ